MLLELTDEEKGLLGFHLACRLDDYGKEIARARQRGNDVKGATEQWQRLEQLIYTKIMPESWCGPKPNYWK